MIVGKTLGVSSCTGSMAELNIGVLLSSLDEVGLVTEAVCKDERAALIDKVLTSLVALLTLGNVGLHDNLRIGKTGSSLSTLNCVDEVKVIGGVLVVQENEAYLELLTVVCLVVSNGSLAVIVAGSIAARGRKSGNRDNHDNCESNRKNLLKHLSNPPNLFIIKSIPRGSS